MLLLLTACLAEVEPCAKQVFFIDADGDGVGGERMAIRCQGDATMVSVTGDCDDQDPSVTEAAVRFLDEDGDGWGDGLVEVCGDPGDTVEVNGDCDDGDPSIHPSADELCDGVDTDCDGQIAEARVPQDYGTVQEAVDAGEPWVCLDEGSFSEGLELSGASLLLEGQGSGLSVLEGKTSRRVVELDDAELVLRGLSVVGGEAELGAGVFAMDSELELEGVELSGHRCESDEGCMGTALYLEDSRASLAGVRIHDNEAVGADQVRGVGLATEWSELWLEDVVIEDNLASSGGTVTGSAMWTKGSVEATRLTLRSNRVAIGGTYGSAWYHRSDELVATNLGILGTEVLADQAASCGVLCLYNADASLVNSAVVGNESPEGADCAGLMLANSSRLELLNTDVSHNGAVGQGQGVVCGDGGGNDLSVAYSNLRPPGEDTFPGLDGMELGEGVLNELPLYTSLEGEPADWDLSLTSDSPLIDAGDPALLDLDGSVSDIGVLGGPHAE